MRFSIRTISFGTAAVAAVASFWNYLDYPWIWQILVFVATVAFLASVEVENDASRTSYVLSWMLVLSILGICITMTVLFGR